MLDESSIDRLIEARILRECSPGEFTVTESLKTELDQMWDHIDASGWRTVLEGVKSACKTDEQANLVLSALDERPERGARFLGIQAATDFTITECLQLTYLLEDFYRQAQHDAGVPNSFLSIHGDQLPLVLSLTPKAIVYVWQSNCDPCDTMREEFESIFSSVENNELGLYAVYGPDAAEWLYERYSVVGAPTTLFFVNGEIDARLQGAQYRSVIVSEIETLQEMPA